MVQTVKAVIDQYGQVKLLESVRLPEARRALVTILEEEPATEVSETALLNEQSARWTLVAGFPPEPTYSDFMDNLQATTTFPVPVTLLHPLFDQRCGVDVSQCKTTESREDFGRLVSTAHGFCGTPESGYQWESQTSLDSSADPMEEHLTTYNLPGIRLEWRYALNKIGQFGHCAYRHRSLWVEFDDAAAQSHFEHLWQWVFGTPPIWQAETPRHDVEREAPEA
jgi:hypothetical protein